MSEVPLYPSSLRGPHHPRLAPSSVHARVEGDWLKAMLGVTR